jgi:hypothetical protein
LKDTSPELSVLLSLLVFKRFIFMLASGLLTLAGVHTI